MNVLIEPAKAGLSWLLKRPRMRWLSVCPTSMPLPEGFVRPLGDQPLCAVTKFVYVLHNNGFCAIPEESVRERMTWTCPGNAMGARYSTKPTFRLHMAVDNLGNRNLCRIEIGWKNLNPGAKVVIEILCHGQINEIRFQKPDSNLQDVFLSAGRIRVFRWSQCIAYVLTGISAGIAFLVSPISGIDAVHRLWVAGLLPITIGASHMYFCSPRLWYWYRDTQRVGSYNTGVSWENVEVTNIDERDQDCGSLVE